MKPAGPPGDDRLARRALAGVWAAMLLAAVGFVLTHGVDVPYLDDWELVPVLAGGESLSAGWLWEPQNEHRFPVSKLLLWAAARLTGGDERAGMLLVVALLGTASLGLLRAARRLRGRASLADAFFPLALLHWGHHENMLWSLQVHMVSAVWLLLALAITMTAAAEPRGRGRAVRLCLATGLLMLHTSAGLVMGVVLTAWLAWVALAGTDRALRRTLRVGLPLLAALAVLTVRGLPGLLDHPPDPGLFETAQTSLQFLSSAFGTSVGWTLWPWAGLALSALVAWTLGMLVAVVRRRPEERARAGALLALLAAVGAVAAAIGYGRAHKGWEAGFSFRYVTLATPVLVFVYLAWLVHGGPRLRRLITSGLCLLMLGLAVPNTLAGLREGGRHRALTAALLSDIRAGLPPAELAARHAPALYPDAGLLAERLELMRRAGLGPYR